MKGELENKIVSLAFDQCIIFRPGLLVRKDSDRRGERIGAGMLNFLNGLGLIRKFRPLPTSILAGKLARAPKLFTDGKHVIALDDIFKL